ncbi:MAG: hypothetical protein VKP62_04625 [Candidatus Sericytochromatia bacterium]|nr:hypothetical protein [Candidatus Sericytochromatia bacterium]
MAAPLDLGDLPAELVVQLAGPPAVELRLPGLPILYAERVYGKWGTAGWESATTLQTAHRTLQVRAPQGRLTLSVDRLRLFLAPAWQKSYEQAEADQAPPPIQEALREDGAPITEHVFVLRARTPYHARVATETLSLPPDRWRELDRRPTRQVLWLSDLPFLEGRPQRPPTPRTRQIR